MLVLFVTMILIFFLLAVRSEINAHEIRQNGDRIERTRQGAVYQSCLDSVGVLTRFNNAQQSLADLERVAIGADRADALKFNTVRQKRIRVYEESLIPLPECEPKKP